MSALNKLFEAVVESLTRHDWPAAARLCDPASMTIFKRDLLKRVSPDRPTKSLTADDLMRMQPDMPKQAAEYQVAMQAMHSNPEAILQDEVPGVPDAAALRAMSPEEVFARHLASYSLDHQIQRAQRYTNVPRHVVERVRAEPWPVPGYLLLTTFNDGDRVGCIVYRRDFGSAAPQSKDNQDHPGWAEYTPDEKQLALDLSRGFPEFAPCYKQSDSSWRMIARHGFLGQGSFAFSFGENPDGTETGEGLMEEQA